MKKAHLVKEEKCGKSPMHKDFHWKRCLVRTLMVCVMVFVGETIPKFGKILSLVGGSTVTLLTFVFPPLFYMRLCDQKNVEWMERIPLDWWPPGNNLGLAGQSGRPSSRSEVEGVIDYQESSGGSGGTTPSATPPPWICHWLKVKYNGEQATDQFEGEEKKKSVFELMKKTEFLNLNYALKLKQNSQVNITLDDNKGIVEVQKLVMLMRSIVIPV
uniref:Amino acid transporter transmembrane domain-containing protein n=1 Tax=Timema poppense TaxID=170557 RepID=A0A7R9CII1_TIMPO|nr:unnamed protein product [Timema poppensis]